MIIGYLDPWGNCFECFAEASVHSVQQATSVADAFDLFQRNGGASPVFGK